MAFTIRKCNIYHRCIFGFFYFLFSFCYQAVKHTLIFFVGRLVYNKRTFLHTGKSIVCNRLLFGYRVRVFVYEAVGYVAAGSILYMSAHRVIVIISSIVTRRLPGICIIGSFCSIVIRATKPATATLTTIIVFIPHTDWITSKRSASSCRIYTREVSAACSFQVLHVLCTIPRSHIVEGKVYHSR